MQKERLTQDLRLWVSPYSFCNSRVTLRPRVECDERKCIVVHRVGIDETPSISLPHLIVAPAHRHPGRDDPADC